MTPPPRRVRALSIHAGYRCRQTGVCCSSGWDIPVEPEVERGLRAALRSGALSGQEAVCFHRGAGLPHGARVVLGKGSTGRCVFLEADRRCAVHRQLGTESLPSAVRRADLLLVHLADPETLARRLSRCEPAGVPPTAW